MSSKKALITGVTGQDGAYLSKFLLDKGYKVYGGYRRNANYNLSRLDYLGIESKIELLPLELLEYSNILRVLEKVQPDEVYNLAAQSFIGIAFEQPLFTSDVTGLGALRMLEAIRTVNAKMKYYQASSSEQFGRPRETPQNEKTPFNPRSPYAIAKTFAHYTTVNYREAHGMFCCCGILFNHESPLRGLEFVTRKITRSIAMIKKGKQEKLYLGNLESRRDWGYAPEYVEAIWQIMQQSEPDDYVIATGENHSVQEFVQEAFKCTGLEWKDFTSVDPKLKRPTEVDHIIGDSSKARAKFNWQAKTKFKDLVRIMVEADLARV